jgi:hypothetical protein
LVKRLVKQLLLVDKKSEMSRIPLIFIFHFLFFISFLYFIILLSLISMFSCEHPYPNGTARTLLISPYLRCRARLLSDGVPSSSSSAAVPVPARLPRCRCSTRQRLLLSPRSPLLAARARRSRWPALIAPPCTAPPVPCRRRSSPP